MPFLSLKFSTGWTHYCQDKKCLRAPQWSMSLCGWHVTAWEFRVLSGMCSDMGVALWPYFWGKPHYSWIQNKHTQTGAIMLLCSTGSLNSGWESILTHKLVPSVSTGLLSFPQFLFAWAISFSMQFIHSPSKLQIFWLWHTHTPLTQHWTLKRSLLPKTSKIKGKIR